jgi:hypothetical protein
MIYTENSVNELYESNLRTAKDLLKTLPIYCGVEPKFTGLTGWVFEQTIRHCIQKELDAMDIKVEIEEQVALIRRAKVDLKIGNTAIEIKTSGLFSRDDIAKYKTYQIEAKTKNWQYVFLSIGETTFRTGIIEALGRENVVLLYEYDGSWRASCGEWQRFIGLIAKAI